MPWGASAGAYPVGAMMRHPLRGCCCIPPGETTKRRNEHGDTGIHRELQRHPKAAHGHTHGTIRQPVTADWIARPHRGFAPLAPKGQFTPLRPERGYGRIAPADTVPAGTLRGGRSVPPYIYGPARTLTEPRGGCYYGEYCNRDGPGVDVL